jgi:signal transduction histidine kinase
VPGTRKPPARRRSLRVRLTALYGGLFLIMGCGLLAVTYLLATHSFGNVLTLPKTVDPSLLTPGELKRVAMELRATELHELLTGSVFALVVMSVVAVLFGWMMAGRALRPIHRITATARRLSSENLHERVALAGPADELKDLADTFDGMLDRLDRAFDSQKRFIANASHELRTPLAIQRATLQIRLADAAPADLPRIREELLVANRRSEDLIEGLLTLARCDRGLTGREPVDLVAVVTEVLDACAGEIAEAGVRLARELRPMRCLGDPVLLARLVDNLVRNAIRYNVPAGEVEVRTAERAGLTVRNSGPLVPAECIDELFEPFHRLAPQRTEKVRGAGLGLSIAKSIVTAHGGTITAAPGSRGGLTVRVELPRSEAARHGA